MCHINRCYSEGEGREMLVREASVVEMMDKGLAPAEGLDAAVEVGVCRFVPADDASDSR